LEAIAEQEWRPEVRTLGPRALLRCPAWAEERRIAVDAQHADRKQRLLARLTRNPKTTPTASEIGIDSIGRRFTCLGCVKERFLYNVTLTLAAQVN
jgi:hypothetical protein